MSARKVTRRRPDSRLEIVRSQEDGPSRGRVVSAPTVGAHLKYKHIKINKVKLNELTREKNEEFFFLFQST